MPEERVGFKYRLWRIVESTPFEYFIMTLIVLNTILLMMKVRQYINDTMESKPFLKSHIWITFFTITISQADFRIEKITCEIVMGVWKFKCDFTIRLEPLCIIWDYIMTFTPIFESSIEILFLSRWQA